jgi:flagellar hook-associated protein 2
MRSLQTLTTKNMVSGGDPNAPATLSQIGIKTNRDGTLSIDTATLNRALTNYPAAVEAIFAPTTVNAIGLQSSFQSISIAATSSTLGLGASSAAYTKAQSALSDEQDKLSRQSDAMTTRLTQQFASMNSKVSAYKSTQTFLDNQIKAWNKSE